MSFVELHTVSCTVTSISPTGRSVCVSVNRASSSVISSVRSRTDESGSSCQRSGMTVRSRSGTSFTSTLDRPTSGIRFVTSRLASSVPSGSISMTISKTGSRSRSRESPRSTTTPAKIRPPWSEWWPTWPEWSPYGPSRRPRRTSRARAGSPRRYSSSRSRTPAAARAPPRPAEPGTVATARPGQGRRRAGRRAQHAGRRDASEPRPETRVVRGAKARVARRERASRFLSAVMVVGRTPVISVLPVRFRPVRVSMLPISGGTGPDSSL